MGAGQGLAKAARRAGLQGGLLDLRERARRLAGGDFLALVGGDAIQNIAHQPLLA